MPVIKDLDSLSWGSSLGKHPPVCAGVTWPSRHPPVGSGVGEPVEESGDTLSNKVLCPWLVSSDSVHETGRLTSRVTF